MNQTLTQAGYAAWLRYVRVEDECRREEYRTRCAEIVLATDLPLLQTAGEELARALEAMTGSAPRVREGDPPSGAHVLIGVIGSGQSEIEAAAGEGGNPGEDGFVIRSSGSGQSSCLVIAGATARGALYGTFHFIRLLQTGASLDHLRITEAPVNRLRMMNHWDNMDGSIERGYAGRSIFFRNNRIVEDLSRIRDYARLMASIGINAVAINNVNVHEEETKLIADAYLPDVASIAALFREYGIRLYLSISFAAPMAIGGLDTADPLSPSVRAWWAERAKAIYREIPDFGGFLVKADSEFRPGPFTYGRNHADGANMLAAALAPHGGQVIWRCFVYNCQQDWRDRKTDRARAAYDHFKPLDGKFADNVILQIKNGPIDFQVREPVSPLFGGMHATNQLLELQITQEYTGQQKHLCYLVPQWKEVFEFDTHAEGEGSTVARIASGFLYHRPVGGVAGVSNIGDDEAWTGHPLAQANLYGFGRLAWNPLLTAGQITQEWVQLTFGCDAETQRIIADMLLRSWRIYESYTAPLGVGFMVNPHNHYGPNVDGYEYDKWGTYHYADHYGIGVDRTLETGTGYTGQYHSPLREIYNSLETCPDELLLFFHHVPYTHELKSGKTVIQHIYDSRFEGADMAADLLDTWQSLRGKVDEACYTRVLERLAHQAEHAKEWRDVINTYFYRKTGIPDAKGRQIY